MKEKIPERLRHALMAFLLSFGIVMPLLGVLDESLLSAGVIPLMIGIIILFEAVSLHRIAAATAGCVVLIGLGAWILGGDGGRMLSDTGLAVSLRMKGIRTAIPLAGQSAAEIITAAVTLISCFAALRKATCIPALLMCAATGMSIWLTDQTQLIPWMLPALTAGLALLMVSRFESTSPIRILPWAACIVTAAFLITGSGMTWQPLKEKADEIRQAILDRLFFTEARDVFSLYSEGYSPQGPDQLGGKPNPSEHPVMQVSTPKAVYLRGSIYNRYDGHGWKNTTGGRRYLWQSRRMDDLRTRLFDQDLPPAGVQNSLSDPVTVSVRMLTDSASTLFVPQRVRELIPGGETVPYFSNSSEIFITRNLQAGDTYEVRAPLFNSTDPGIGTLTDICGSLDDPRWQTVVNTYSELPAHIERPVADLAREVTGVAESPFDKALAIQNYLARNFRYTMDVGEHPENVDFVTSFLLDTKKGYCTYFASAMTVLCRLAGLPARYVEGYLAEPDERGEAVVTGTDAHAWTEVYFKGFGWLTFDATPGRRGGGQSGNNPPPAQNEQTPTPDPERPAPSPEPEGKDPEETEDPQQEAPTTEPTEEPTGEPEEPEDNPDSRQTPPEEENRQDSGPTGQFPWWWLLAATLAAALAIRCRITSPVYREHHAKTEEERFDIWTGEIITLLRAENIVRRNGETLMAFARRADSTRFFSESLNPAGECLSLIRYSRAEPLETDTGLMRDTALMIKGEMSRNARIKYWLTRIFTSSGRRKKLVK